MFSILVLGGMIIVAALLLDRFYEDEITRYAVDGINRQVKAQVDVENVKLSFLKKFPDASLEFEHVLIRSVPDYNDADFKINTDTLLFAEQLYLRFNMFKILKHEYLLREVQVRSGILRLFTDLAGNTNYEFWKKPEEPGGKNFLLELDNVKLTGIQLDYINRALELETFSYIEKLSLKGKFSKLEYKLNFDLEGLIKGHSKEGIIFLRDQQISSSASLFITPERVDITSGNLQLAGQKLSVSGNITRGNLVYLWLSVKGEQLDLGHVVRYLASYSDKLPEGMRAGGILSFDASISGQASKTRMPGIKADFTINDGWVQTGKQNNKEIRQIKTQGKYSNGSAAGPLTTMIEFTNTSLLYGNSRLGGDFSIQDLTYPRINHRIKFELDLEDIQEFLGSDSRIMDMKGMLVAELGVKGNQKSLLKISREELLNNHFEARVRLENAGFRLSRSIFTCSDLNGDLFYGDHLQIGTISTILAGNYVSFTGRGDNLKEFLFTNNGNLWLDLDVYSDKADLNDLFGRYSGDKNDSSGDSVQIHDRIIVKSRFWFDELVLKDFSAWNVMGDLFYKPRRLTVNNLNLSSMDGLISAEGLIEQQADNQYLVKVISEVSRIDIHKGFASFNNFGQDFITDKHLKGSLSGKVNFSAGFNEQLKIKKESILADYDIIIHNGELVEFEPMQKLSRFIDVEELENVKFSTLANQIFIRNQEVLIPGMDINSSAFNITGSGIHGFDNHFKYKIKVSLSELLSGKASRHDKQAEQFGAIEDDGLGRVYIYLIIEGSPEGTNVKYDRKGALLNIREQMKEEKMEIKEILNEEFGLFKKDSASFNETEEHRSPGFILEWEEEEIEKSDSLRKVTLKRDNKPGQEKFIIRWEDEEETDTVDFEKGKQRRLIKRK